MKNKYSEVRKWNVGCRYGEKIRSYQKNKMQQYENSESSQNGKRPHIRKAHWERYHVGEGRKDIITKWKTSVYKGYKQDKIEMRGDRAEMSDFPLYLNMVTGGLDCRDQAIGGFSFVVKIYAVPVVEIIG